MTSPQERARNNVRAGILVTVAVALGVTTVLVISDLGEMFRPRRSYTVSFDVSDGVKDLKEQAAVRVGGVQMGRVTEVRPRLDGAPFTTIEVDFSLDKRVALYSDAEIVISSQLIGADAWLDVYSVGDPEKGTAEGAVIKGISAPGSLTALLGPEMVSDARQIVEDFKATSDKVRTFADRIADEDWPRWARSVDEVTSWASSATGRIDEVMAEGRGLLDDVRGVVAENREPIRATIGNVQSTSEDTRAIAAQLRTGTLDKLERLLDSGQQGLDSAASVLESVRADYPAWSTDAGEALGAARLTAQQLKLASIELRRSPWKLLYRPSRGEAEHEFLYEAARSFALSASDLRAAAESARRILDDHRERLDEETVREIDRFLLDALERYAQVQSRLVGVLVPQ
jgi:ABC-type transporter Mla subunit MlaD